MDIKPTEKYYYHTPYTPLPNMIVLIFKDLRIHKYTP